jgi:hypothetical protein
MSDLRFTLVGRRARWGFLHVSAGRLGGGCILDVALGPVEIEATVTVAHSKGWHMLNDGRACCHPSPRALLERER